MECGPFAGQDEAQLGAHLVAQLGEALGLRGLALQGIHLARDFVEDVVEARQVQLGFFEARFGEALLRFELGDAGGFFDDRAAIGRLAAQDLSNTALFDDRVGLRSETGAHEDVLDIAQAAELAVEQVFAFARPEQAARDDDLALLESGAIELATTNLENDGRMQVMRFGARSFGRVGSGRINWA